MGVARCTWFKVVKVNKVLFFLFYNDLKAGACPGGGDAGGRRPLFEMFTYNFCLQQQNIFIKNLINIFTKKIKRHQTQVLFFKQMF